jgi:heavy metal translocating P-type ATPase
MLGGTSAALVVGGALWFADLDAAANVAFALAGAGPAVRLTGGMIDDLRRGRPGVDVIAVLAVTSALILGEYLTAGIIGLMLATGQYLDAYAAGRAERDLTALVARAPRVAHLIEGGTVRTVDVEKVAPGDRLLVKSHEVVPVDGLVGSGTAVLDESALTGEPLPVDRAAGDLVRSGAVNAASSFELRAVATAEASTYAGIIRLVHEAQESRPPVVRLADRWAAWFVPFTLLLAVGAWAISGDPMRALAVLVVATPCPLLLAVPIAIVSGVSRAARRGIIFRGGAALEALARTDRMLLDKTGTLTVGSPALAGLTALDPSHDSVEALRLGASLDQASTHILARALVAEARRRGLATSLPEDVVEEPGSGVTGTVEGHRVAVGNAAWVCDGPEPAAVAAFRRRMARVAPLTVFIGVDGVPVAAATFDDTIRRDAARTLRNLRSMGIEKIDMATGDHPVVAQSVGLAIGVDQVLAECTPEDKVEALRDMSTEGTVAMVGDGINDAPALAAADVGIAMGARGATASSEASDVVLVVDQLRRLIDAVGIAQRSRTIAIQSIAIGMGLSLAAMGAAAVGLLAPIAGALLQEVIDVAAIGNALRALAGPSRAAAGPKLSPELSARLQAEHEELMPRLEEIRVIADRLDELAADVAMRNLEEIRSLLVDVIVPHEIEDDRVIYPELAGVMEGDDPLGLMSRSHREIFHLIDVFDRVMRDLPGGGPEIADLRDLRRLLYSLHAILRLHFEQEEELYASLDENYGRAPLETSVAAMEGDGRGRSDVANHRP